MAQSFAAVGLLGPPEINHHSPAAVDKPVTTTGDPFIDKPEATTGDPFIDKPEATTGDPFIDLVDSTYNESDEDRPPMSLTENASPTFVTSGNPLVDFFFHVVPDTPAETVADLLSNAWDSDPLTSLKLVLQLRGVRGTGKSDRQSFYSAALWLHNHHPKTLALNVPAIAEFGYFKDLPEILYRLINGPNIRKLASEARPCGVKKYGKKKKQGVREDEDAREKRIVEELARMKLESETAAVLRRKKRSEMASRAVDRYNRDSEYRFLYDRVSDHFAGMIAADISHLAAGEVEKISLTAKWCPSLDSCFDRSTLLCEAIARRLFPRESDPELAGVEEAHYAYRIRDRLRRALVPLRCALQIPEVYMSAGQWDSLPYSRVPSVAMKNYKKIFMNHDEVRFSEFLKTVKEGKAKIAAGALLPHEILAPACTGEDDEVAELQWRRLVADMAAKGTLKNCIAVCDVSGSMGGTPMEVCVALGLLVSELSEEPWKGRVITFSAKPQIQLIKGDTIKEKSEFVRKMDWGMNTNFQKVFDRLLEVAVKGNLPADAMIKRVLVFSDMEFDQAGGKLWETDYELICRKYKKAGYENAVPEIVFWNLRSSRATPVPANRPGVALVSGFSKNLLQIFFESDGSIDPVSVMQQAIAGREYGKLRVFD